MKCKCRLFIDHQQVWFPPERQQFSAVEHKEVCLHHHSEPYIRNVTAYQSGKGYKDISNFKVHHSMVENILSCIHTNPV